MTMGFAGEYLTAFGIENPVDESTGFDFEDYSVGNLVGQDDWDYYNSTTADDVTVSNVTAANSTTQSVNLVTSSTTIYTGAEHSISLPDANCIFSVYVRRTASCGFNCYTSMRLHTPVNFAFVLWSDANHSSYPPTSRGADTFTHAQITDDVWYLVEMEYRVSDNHGRFRIDGGAWTAWTSAYDTGTVDRLVIAGKGYSSGVTNTYIDEIKITLT